MSGLRLDVASSNGKSPVELMARVSASRLATFHQCRLKFYFRYVEKLHRPKSPALHLGGAVHWALQFWNRARWKSEPIDLERLHELFLAFWSVEQCKNPVSWGDESETELRDSAWALARMYFEKTPIPPDEKPEAVEVAVEADLSAHGLPTLIGFIDLVRAGGKIVDFKTTGQTPNAERVAHLHELQLSCYGLLYRDATGNREGGFELHHLVKLKTPKLIVTEVEPMTNAQEARLFRAMESYVSGVEREDWVPNPSVMGCACCEYFSECRQWGGRSGRRA